jgi:RNA polymerase subunit RPABC4/transcription elongation factor Spt4
MKGPVEPTSQPVERLHQSGAADVKSQKQVHVTEITAEGETMRVRVAARILDAWIDFEVVVETQNADIARRVSSVGKLPLVLELGMEA